MKILALAFTLILTGCTPVFNLIAESYDRADPCQSRSELGRPKGYKIPSFCGASANKSTAKLFDTHGNYIGMIK